MKSSFQMGDACTLCASGTSAFVYGLCTERGSVSLVQQNILTKLCVWPGQVRKCSLVPSNLEVEL